MASDARSLDASSSTTSTEEENAGTASPGYSVSKEDASSSLRGSNEKPFPHALIFPGDHAKYLKGPSSFWSDARSFPSNDFEWHGHMPCIDASHHGCLAHFSANSPLFCNPLLIPKPQLPLWKTIFGMSSNTPAQTKEFSEPLPSMFRVSDTELPFDLNSTQTLAPVHPSIPYHLAFYHLYCARRNLDRAANKSPALVNKLWCKGRCLLNGKGPECEWVSEVFFDGETFIQRQVIDYTMDKATTVGTLKFNFCPHAGISITKPVFGRMSGFTHVRLSVARDNRIEDGLIHSVLISLVRSWEPWSSDLGRYMEGDICRGCHAEVVVCIRVLGDKLITRLATYKDLGPGTKRNHPKWLSALPRSEYRRRPCSGKYEIMERVEGMIQSYPQRSGPLPTYTEI